MRRPPKTHLKAVPNNDAADNNALDAQVVALDRQKEEFGTFDIGRMNREHALVLLGSKAVVYRDAHGGDDNHRFVTLDAFETYYANRFVQLPAPDGKMRHVTFARAWRQHKERRTFDGVEFYPDPNNAPGRSRFLNLWKGFAVMPAVEPDERRYAVFRDHLLTNVCNGDAGLFSWVWAFFANMAQRPRDRPGVALVLRGGRGVGKTIVGDTFGRLFPQNYFLVDDSRYITGNFNAHMAACLLLQADEAVWAGDKSAEGRLKGLITSSIQQIEAKGVDPIRLRNFVRVLMTSNERWVVPAGEDERRFAVLDVNPRCQGNHEYFAELLAELDDGGLSHLLGDLLRFDPTTENLRQIPLTRALLYQKVHSLHSVASWWLGRLMAGTATSGAEEWADVVPFEVLFEDYIRLSDKVGVKRKQDETVFGHEMHTLLPGLHRIRRPIIRDGDVSGPARRVWQYRLPPLGEARNAFDAFIGQPMEWPTT